MSSSWASKIANRGPTASSTAPPTAPPTAPSTVSSTSPPILSNDSPQTAPDKAATLHGLTAKERDQLRLHQRLEKMSAPERIAAREAQQAMRHEKTLERWGKDGATKASKVVYMNDLLVKKGDSLAVASDKRKTRSTAKPKVEVAEKKRNKMKTWSKQEKGLSSMKRSILEKRRALYLGVERLLAAQLEEVQDVAVVAIKAPAKPAPSLVSMLMGDDSSSSSESDSDKGDGEGPVASEQSGPPPSAPAAHEGSKPAREASDQIKRHRELMASLERTFEDVRTAKKDGNGPRVLELVTELRRAAAEARRALVGIERRLQAADIQDVCDDDNDEVDHTDRVARCSFFPPLNRLGVGRATLPVDWRTPKRYPAVTTNLCPQDETLPPLAVPDPLPPQTGFVREYVTNVLTDQLDDVAFSLIQKLRDAQRKLKEKQPLMYKSRMRYVTGLREALTGLAANRVRAVLLAPDVEAAEGEADLDADLMALTKESAAAGGDDQGGRAALSDAAIRQLRTSASKLGLDGSVRTIIAACILRRIPVIFCMSRQRFAHALGQPKVRFSIVAIYSATGAYDEMRTLVKEGERCHAAYTKLIPV